VCGASIVEPMVRGKLKASAGKEMSKEKSLRAQEKQVLCVRKGGGKCQRGWGRKAGIFKKQRVVLAAEETYRPRSAA